MVDADIKSNPGNANTMPESALEIVTIWRLGQGCGLVILLRSYPDASNELLPEICYYPVAASDTAKMAELPHVPEIHWPISCGEAVSEADCPDVQPFKARGKNDSVGGIDFHYHIIATGSSLPKV